jgi:2-polyprenyl-3-methyl-5-hydroxy-6-metoxy-1,4-benzoquinol methylase
LAKREVLNDIGWFDERFGIGMYEDDDLCLRAVQKEHHLAIAMDAFVHHIGHATFQGSGVQTAPLLQENRKKMAEKYGVDFTYYLHPRPDVIMLVPAGANRILDVGCAAGATGMELINRQDCELYGIEMQPEPASLAAQFYKAVHVEDVELFELPYPDHYFDAILFADVLEHLKDPWGTIRRYSRCLKPGGAIVASIPNVSHAEVLIQLLQGYWSYTDAGLLDRTHLRFFTRHTIKSLFPEDSFSIEQMMATTIPIVDEVERFLPELSKLANHYGLNVTYLEDDAHIYQFIVCAIKTADQG